MNFLPELNKPTLFVRRGLRSKASLELTLPGVGEEDRVILLSPRLGRFLFVLANARHSQDVPTHERGFLSKCEIARQLARLPGSGSTIAEETVREYASKIRRAIAKVVDRLPEDVRPVFELIENKRGYGYRLGGAGLNVVVMDDDDVRDLDD